MDDVKTEYLRTRDLERLSKKAFQEAAKNAMEVAGHVIKSLDGWLVREDADGTITRLKKLPENVKVSDLLLDGKVTSP